MLLEHHFLLVLQNASDDAEATAQLCVRFVHVQFANPLVGRFKLFTWGFPTTRWPNTSA